MRRSELHVGIGLARRIERAEERLLEAAVEIHRQQPGSAAFAIPVGGGVAVGFDAASPINKVIGAGFDEVARESLDAVEGAFSRIGVPTIVELCPLADASFVTGLADRHYRLTGFENALVRSLTGAVPEARAAGIAIRDVTPEALPAWAALVAEGFGAEPRSALQRMLGTLLGTTPRTRCLVAEIEGAPAGGAAVRIDDGVALSFATSTLPRFRERGVQTALVAASIFAAKMADADLVVATTQPGSQSQRTFERLGFQLAFSRAILTSWPQR